MSKRFGFATTSMTTWLSCWDAEGPFKGCKPDKHAERIARLPLIPPPAGLF